MHLRHLTHDELEHVYDTELKQSFPPAELKPLAVIEETMRRGSYETLGLFDEAGDYLGCCFVWKGRPGVALIDYLCVTPEKRSRGCGAFMLRHFSEVCDASRLTVIEAEAPSERDEREHTLVSRRVRFYERCGFVRRGFSARIFTVKYTVLTDPCDMTDRDVMEEYDFIYRSAYSAESYARNIEIPCD